MKTDGIFIFTVPLDTNNQTVESASLLPGGEVKHLFLPEYHRDPIRSHEPILAFRNYGFDILDRLVDAGFLSLELRKPGNEMPWDYARTVIVAYKAKMPNNRLNSDSLRSRFTSPG